MDKKFLDAIDNYHEHFDIEPKKLLDDDELICECHCVSARDVRQLFADAKNVDFEVLKSRFGFGTACSSCIKSKEDWLQKLF